MTGYKIRNETENSGSKILVLLYFGASPSKVYKSIFEVVPLQWLILRYLDDKGQKKPTIRNASKGWKGSRKSIPASYLIGYLAGKKAISKGAKSALLYSGTRRYTQRMAAGYDKLLGGGSTSVAYSINVRRCTESAKVKLEKAGGNVTVLEKVVPKEVQTTNG